MHLDELKKELAGGDEMIDKIVERIRREARTSDMVVFTYTKDRPNTNENNMNKLQAALLREKGYKVEYNSACTWYEVTGWVD